MSHRAADTQPVRPMAWEPAARTAQRLSTTETVEPTEFKSLGVLGAIFLGAG